MCKIDAAFAAISLDEKIDPLERFMQALDESLISRNFRALLLKHFSANWHEVLGNIASVEHSLDAVSASENDLAKLISFVTNDSISFRLRHVMRYVLDDSQSVNSYPLFMFVVDAAREFSNGSPFDLYYSNLAAAMGIAKTTLLRFVFGNDYITDNFFNAETLKGLHPDERTEKLWHFFCETTKSVNNSLSDRTPSELYITPEELLALIDSEEGPPTEQTHRLLKGFDFLKRWMEFDAKAGIYHCSNGLFFRKFEYELSIFLGGTHDESARIRQWCRGLKKDIELAFLSNFDVATATDDIRQLWAEKMEQHFTSFTFDWSAYSDLPEETCQQSFLEESRAYLDALILKLTPAQRDVWIQFSIDNFVTDSLNNVPSHSQNFDDYGRWCFGNTYPSWKSLFIATLDRLSIEQQLVVLSHRMLFPMLPKSVVQTDVAPFLQEHDAWWNSLLLDLKAKDGFTKSLLPKWTIAARTSGSSSELLPDIDNCIGYLRGVVNKPVTSEAQLQIVQHQLKTLLGYLDSQSPEKSLKHRLMLMRASQIPLADEGLNYRQQLKDAEWYSPLRELSKVQFAKVTGPCNLLEMEQAQTAFYKLFSKAVANFCLSRLRLRKGEKALNGKYEQAQCTEPSPIWRQGYLKALSEIGLDLDGQVHQTVNFVKENDPDPDVRTIAKETYKSVRRQSSSPQTYADYARGIIAAEWWLLMCQRQVLELDIDHAAALNTRRKLLRNP